jgi:hypothetical protein
MTGLRGDKAMFGIVKQPWSWDESLLDDRNERPLAIAFATIVAVWALAFALTLASWHFGAHQQQPAERPAVVMSQSGR